MTMDTSGVLEAARDAYARRDWPRARDGFEAARASGALTADDVYALAESAWWLGLVDDALAYYEEAYRRHLGEGRPRQAAMSAIAAAVSLFLRGDTVVGSGWISRAQRLLQNADGSVEQGWMIHIFEVEAALEGPDPDAVIASARRVQDIGRRGADPSLVALATVGEGRALIRQGRVPQGMALLDEAMLATLSEEVDPATAGNIYCHLMSACQELADLHRMETWTRATADWCERLPAAVLFMGICRVHRAQLLHARGSWDHAEKEAIRVCEDLSDIHTPASRRRAMPSVRSTACGATSPGRTRHTGTRTGSAATRSPVWRCCGWLRTGPTGPWHPSPRPSKEQLSVWREPGCARPRWTSRLRPPRRPPPAWPARSWMRSPATTPPPDSRPWRITHEVRCY